ncbi:hypothetical protein BDP55DRAFT_719575 [Colletotrichum godetiae]|uniref:Uncharacterized protein n=1 Tax=Colletotrichum godetiae TaxID=1209918 RepID=A0AAJ0EPI9_9PEZI|nr:uncharacterized protein BDP55DRAFT_719575 [Colletotrichum godetiae]KAK1659761.1 hypothetical protein BDP55DRAFT_719575 [Colletotrichum godetiae]
MTQGSTRNKGHRTRTLSHGHDYNRTISASIWSSKNMDISHFKGDMPSSRVKRLVLIYTTDSLEDYYNIICANATIGLVRHRKNSTVAVSRSTRLGDLNLVHHISHPSIATIHAIFLNEKKSYVIYEHLEVDITHLVFTIEVELASALSQLLDGIQHLIANGVPFSADSVQVSLSGIVKIVLNIGFRPCDNLVVDQHYWATVCTNNVNLERRPLMSYHGEHYRIDLTAFCINRRGPKAC